MRLSKPEKPVILKRSDFIAGIRSDISDLRQFITNSEYEMSTIQDRIQFAKEQKLRKFRALEKRELRILKKRIKRAESTIKELQTLLLFAENALG